MMKANPNAVLHPQHNNPHTFSLPLCDLQQFEDPYIALMMQIQQHQHKQQSFAKTPNHQLSHHMTCHSQQNTTPTERMQHQPTGVAFSKLSRNEFIELFLEKAFMGDSQETSQTSHANSDEFLTMLSLPSEQQQMVNTNPVNDRTGISSHNYTLEDSLLLDDSNFMQNFREWLFLSQQMQSLQSYL